MLWGEVACTMITVQCRSCAINSNVDENGIHYMVFTRVILGNVEPLHCRSEQCHPSDAKYDRGVDDLENPTHYVVLHMKMYTHIYPECAVSFRIFPRAEGKPLLSNTKRYIGLEKAARTPKSPRLPFHLLIDAISNNITAENMNLVTSNFELFKSKKICRDEFIRQLRLIVGDTLLRSTITSFQCKVPPKSIELVLPK